MSNKFDKLFAKKKKPTAKVEAKVELKEPKTEVIAKIEQTQKKVEEPEPKVAQKNWFEEVDEEEDDTPVARTDIVQDSKVIQKQKRNQEAAKHGEQFWEEEETEGKQRLKEKKKQEEIERQRKKLEQKELRDKVTLEDPDVFKVFGRAQFVGGAKYRKPIAKNLNEEFMSLEEAAEHDKVSGKKKSGLDKKTESQEDNLDDSQKKDGGKKFTNKFRDLEQEIDDGDADAKERAQEFKKMLKSEKKQDHGWSLGVDSAKSQKNGGFEKGTGKVEEHKDMGFQRGGGVIESPEGRSGFSRGEFGTGEVKQFKPDGEAPKYRESGTDGGFNRKAFGTSKADEKLKGELEQRVQKPRFKEERKEGGWEKGTGVNEPKAEAKAQVKAEVKVVRAPPRTLANEKTTDWDFDL